MLRHLMAMIFGSLLLIGAVGYAFPAAARPAGTLQLDNERFGSVSLTLDGRELGTVPADAQRDFRVPSGEHALRVRSREGQVVLAQSVLVRPNGSTRVVVMPDQGELTVRNATGRGGRLVIDGVDRGPIDPGAVRSLRLRPGTFSVLIRQSDRVLDSVNLSLRAGDRRSWVAQAPTVADMSLRNPLPVAVRVKVEGRPSVMLEPGDRELLRGLPVGRTDVQVFGPGERLLSRSELVIDPFDGASFLVPMPSDGPVRLVNMGDRSMDVLADGRLVATIAPRAEATIILPIGRVELTLRERARNLVIRTDVRVEPFEEVTLRCDLGRSFVTQEHRLLAELEDLIAALRRLAA